MSDSIFTDEEIEFGEQHPMLGPDYERARKVAQRFMESFKEEHFEKLHEEFCKQFAERLWGDISTFLIGDTECNLQTEMRHIAEGTVFALLHGHKGYTQRYVLRDGLQPAMVRAAIFEQFKDEMIDKGIQERDEEIHRLKEVMRMYRG